MLQRRRTRAQCVCRSRRLQHCVELGADRHVAVLAVAGSTDSADSLVQFGAPLQQTPTQDRALTALDVGIDRPHPKGKPAHWVRRPGTPPTSASNPPGTAQKVGNIDRG